MKTIIPERTMRWQVWRTWKHAVRLWLSSRVVILAYHRVADLPTDPQLLAVPPTAFRDQAEILARCYQVIPLRMVPNVLRELPLHSRRYVALTFDDGYADNLHQAYPILRDYHLPATIFVAAGLVSQDREFWWDALEQLLLHPGILPPRLTLTTPTQTFSWKLGNATNYTHEEFQRDRAWHIASSDRPTRRQELYDEIYHELRPLPPNERWQALADLAAQSGKSLICRDTHRVLTVDEVRQMADGEGIEIGAHTMGHPVLAMLDAAGQTQEMQQSKTVLESMLNHPVDSFSYPYGNYDDYSTATAALARKIGFRYACANFEGLTSLDTDIFQLPRYIVRNWRKDVFHWHLQHWFSGETYL